MLDIEPRDEIKCANSRSQKWEDCWKSRTIVSMLVYISYYICNTRPYIYMSVCVYIVNMKTTTQDERVDR